MGKMDVVAQGHAAWLGHVVQMETEQLSNALKNQDINLNSALNGINSLRRFISDPSHILGSPATKHGEIAEAFEVYIGNALEQIKGGKPIYVWLNGTERFAPADYLLNGAEVQSKFINGAASTLNHLKAHMEKYPDFISNGGSYHIPKDRFEEIAELLMKKSSELRGHQPTLVKNIRALEKATGLKFERDVKPALAAYSEVQTSIVGKTVDLKEEEIRKMDEELRQKHIDANRPYVQAGVQAAALGAALEGTATLVLSIIGHRKDGKTLSMFTADDWVEIAAQSVLGVVKGGIRGGGVYVLTKMGDIPAPAATAVFSAAFGVIEQAGRLRRCEIDEDEFIIESVTVCLDIMVSAVAATIGNAVIPIPVLGALIGSSVGTFLWSVAKTHFNEEEQKSISRFKSDIDTYNQLLASQHKLMFDKISDELHDFHELIDLTFNKLRGPTANFNGSICLARHSGVSSEAIIHGETDFQTFLKNNSKGKSFRGVSA